MPNKKHDLYNYKPSNPNDSKIPNLKQDNYPKSDFQPQCYEVKEVQIKNEIEIEPSDAKESARNIIARLKQRSQDNSQSQTTRKITYEPRIVPEGVIDPDAEQFEVASNVVMPDSNSDMAISLRSLNQRNVLTKVEKYRDVRGKINRLQGNVRASLRPEDIDLIVKKYQHKVVKVTKKEIVIKHTKFGFEIYKNNNDDNWWVVAVKFEELFNPKSCKYITLWSGNTFIGYGFPLLEECLRKTDQLMSNGRTGDVAVRDYVTGWLSEKDRFVSGDEPTSFTWKEYQKIMKWYNENKIRIHVKEARVRDYEDLMEEVKDKKSRGETVSPLVTLQAKLLEAPRKAVNIFAYPVEKPSKIREEVVKAENKLYQIAFAFTE